MIIIIIYREGRVKSLPLSPPRTAALSQFLYPRKMKLKLADCLAIFMH